MTVGLLLILFTDSSQLDNASKLAASTSPARCANGSLSTCQAATLSAQLSQFFRPVLSTKSLLCPVIHLTTAATKAEALSGWWNSSGKSPPSQIGSECVPRIT